MLLLKINLNHLIQIHKIKNKIKTGDSYLTGSYMCMFLVSSVILILFIIKFSNKKKGDVK